MSGFQRVGVVGCGVVGAGFTEVCARAGLDVTVVVRSDEAVARDRGRLVGSLDKGVRKGKTTAAERDAALDRVTFSTSMKSLRGHEFVLEAVNETLPEKLGVLAELDGIVEEPDAVLASSTSSVPIMRLGSATRDPGRVLGVHFFNPVPVMPLAELVGSLRTRETTVERAESLVTGALGKQVLRVQDRPGFLVNALLVPYVLAAVRLLETGAGSAEDIDRGMTLGCGHPMGPLALADLIGLDVIASVGESMYEAAKEPHYAPPALLQRMIEAGLLGRKSGEGFYGYP